MNTTVSCMCSPCPTDYLTNVLPPVVIGILWIISEILTFIPKSVIASNGVLQLLYNIFQAFVARLKPPIPSPIAPANPTLKTPATRVASLEKKEGNESLLSIATDRVEEPLDDLDPLRNSITLKD